MISPRSRRYLLLRGALADADLDPVIAEYEQHIDRRAQALLAEGKISGLYADEPCTAGSRRSVANATRSTRTSTSSTSAGRASFEFLRSDRLLDVVAGLVGSEITCSPVQHTRAKLTRTSRT